MSTCFPAREALRSSFREVFDIVADNATPKQWGDWLRPAVEHAASQGNLDLVMRLLDAGGTGAPGLRGCRGRTLLDAAAEGGCAKVVSALLRAGAKPDLSARSGSKRRSPLHRAALAGHKAAACALMMAGADVSCLDCDKRGPLHLAARAGHENLVSSLLLGGANASAIDKKGDAPLHLAASRGHAEIAGALLLRGADRNALDRLGRSPLHVAAEYGHRGTATVLLAAGADFTCRYGENELSALDSAASNGHAGVLRVLLEYGVEVNDVDTTGYTALHMAADNNQAAAVEALIEAEANVESLDLHNWTPLHCAARYNGCCNAMLALLRHGANIQARETAGEYPLHVAALYLADQAVDLLLRWGADETAINSDGHTAAEIIGTYAVDDDETTTEQRGERVDRLRRLLACAPADRAWRRRRCLILCRHRQFSNAPAARERGSCTIWLEDSPGKVPRMEHRVPVAVEEHSAGRGDSFAEFPPHGETAAESTAGESRDDQFFRGVCNRLIRLTEEGVFRQIVAYL